MSTIFERCGGFARVRKIVSGFYDKALASPVLSPYFADTDMRALIDHQSQFIAQVMGGPVHYSPDQLERAHSRLGIDGAAFAEAAELLEEALEDAGVEPDDAAAVMAEVRRLERVIVARR